MWELDYKESWALKNLCFWTVVLENTLEIPLYCKEIQLVNSKEISPEYSLKRLMLKLKLHYFGYLMGRADSLEKTLMLRRIEGRSRRGWQDEMIGWHHQLDGHEFEQAPQIGDGQQSPVCCCTWGCKESDMNDWLNWTELSLSLVNWLLEAYFTCWAESFSL